MGRPSPFPDFIEPCLPTLRHKAPEGDGWVHEIKWDGYRAQLRLEGQRTTIFTRRGYDWSEKFRAIAEAADELPVKNVIIDGEVIVPRPKGGADFSELQKDLASGSTDRFVFYAFDVVYLDGLDIRPATLLERKEVLLDLLKRSRSKRILYSEHLAISGNEMLQHACNMGLEGIVSKKTDSPYSSGRSLDWIKAKCVNSEVLPIVGFLPAGKSSIGALYLGRYESEKLRYAGKAGTGFSMETAHLLRQALDPLAQQTSPLDDKIRKPNTTWVKPLLLAEVTYGEKTGDGKLRHASFKTLRSREDLS